MEYYGAYAASISPLPNIYRPKQHRKHNSASAHGDDSTRDSSSTQSRRGRTSSSSELSNPNHARTSHDSKSSTVAHPLAFHTRTKREYLPPEDREPGRIPHFETRETGEKEPHVRPINRIKKKITLAKTSVSHQEATPQPLLSTPAASAPALVSHSDKPPLPFASSDFATSATVTPTQSNYLPEIPQCHLTCPASPSFPASYLSNIDFSLPSIQGTLPSSGLSNGDISPPKSPNPSGLSNSFSPPLPPKHTRLPARKPVRPNLRMQANTNNLAHPHNEKQLPALPLEAEPPSISDIHTPTLTVSTTSHTYKARRPPLPRTSSLGPNSVRRPSGPGQFIDDRMQHYHGAMTPEPGTPNLSTSSTFSSQPPHLPPQPQGLSRFSVPFARTESVMSSTSAATTLSSRTMQSSDPPGASSTEDVSSRPFIVRNGRRFLNDPTLPYPLPVDLAELHRQSLRTLLLCQLFGGPLCSPSFQSKPPSKVLEVGCGSGFWSMMCHRYFARHGYNNISFTGLDVADVAFSGSSPAETRPDRDMKWRFVLHDLRHFPWPLPDDEFDLIMTKDMSLATNSHFQQAWMEETMRILKPGGTLEIWDSDHTIRMLRPHLPQPVGDAEDEELEYAGTLGAYIMTANTPLSAPLNNFLVEYNGWLAKAFEARSLSTVPCTTMGPMLLMEDGLLVDIRSRRLAIPLSEMRWEREGVGGVVTKDGKTYIESKGKAHGKERKGPLSAGQSALRQTALLTVVQMIQSLEPVLREVNGKSQDEWDVWIGKMMADLMGDGTAWGECLEVGAWWAKKRI